MPFGANVTFSVTAPALGAGSPEPTVMANSASWTAPAIEGGRTVTFGFDQAYPVGSFAASGQPNHLFVVAPEGITLTSTSPATQLVNGQLAYGCMLNPMFNIVQGWDERLANATRHPSNNPNNYDDSLNIDPSKPGGTSQLITPNNTVVKSMRIPTAGLNDWLMFNAPVMLTVLSEVPAFGTFAPAPTANQANKRLWGTINDINWAAIPSYNLDSVPNKLFFSEAVNTLPLQCAEWGATRNDLYRILRQDAAYNSANSNYSVQYTSLYFKVLQALFRDSISEADRNAIAYRAINYGIQIVGVAQRGGNTTSTAGQGGGLHSFPYFAAALLGDADLQAAAESVFTWVRRPFWVTPDMVGTGSGTKDGYVSQPFFAEHVGFPYLNADFDGSEIAAKYKMTQAGGIGWDGLPAIALRNLPGGVTGLDSYLRGATPLDTADDNAANLAFLDRARTFSPNVSTQVSLDANWRAFYDIVQADYGDVAWPKWTGRPEQPPYGNADGFRDHYFSVGAGAGEVDWTLAGTDYATEPVLENQAFYSMDGFQWIADTATTSNSGTITGLLQGVQQWFAVRRRSASGWGLQSASYDMSTDVAPGGNLTPVPGRRTPSGTPVAAIPVNTVAPALLSKLHPAWPIDEGNFEEVTGLLTTSQIQLACGKGYWTGDPPNNWNYQWESSADGLTNWTPITGADNQQFSRTADQAELFIRCGLTASNATDAAPTIYTNVIECPPLRVLPAGVIMDTTFDASFPIDDVFSFNSWTNNSDAVSRHEPEASFVDGMNKGIWRLDKTGTSPAGWMRTARDVEEGKTYRVTGQLVSDWHPEAAGGFGGELYVSVSNVNGKNWGDFTWNPFPNTTRQTRDFDFTFTTLAQENDLRTRVQLRGINMPSGGSGGGDTCLSRIKIEEVV